MSLVVKRVFVLLVFCVAVRCKHMTKQEWETAVKEYFRVRNEAFNAHDLGGLEAGMSTNIHRFPPGRPTQIGVTAVMASYQNMMDSENGATFLYTNLTDLRTYDDKSAVAEWKTAVNFTSGAREGKGVSVFVIEGNEVKLFTHIFNH